MKVVSTDHKQANNLTNLIVCFLRNGYIFILVCLCWDQYNLLICFYLENLFYYFINHGHSSYILVPGESLVF